MRLNCRGLGWVEKVDIKLNTFFCNGSKYLNTTVYIYGYTDAGITAVNPTELNCQKSGLLGGCQDMSVVEARAATHRSLVRLRVPTSFPKSRPPSLQK